LAKKNDPLLISSLVFKSMKWLLIAEDLEKPLYIIKIGGVLNQLIEVIVSKIWVPYLESNQEIIDKPYKGEG
jgi:hypothetical protein